MNPETIDLSNWRTDEPPTSLRVRVGAVTEPTRNVSARRLGLVAALLTAGVTLTALAITPTVAVAAVPARTLLLKARSALVASSRVHICEFVDGTMTTETWYEGNRWRVTSPAERGGDRIFRYGRLRELILSTRVLRTKWDKEGRFVLSVRALHDEAKPERKGSYKIAVALEDRSFGEPMGLSYWSRRDGKIVSMLEVADQRRDYRMEALAPTYFPKGAVLRYSDRGPTDGLTRRIEVTAVASPTIRQCWTVRQSDGLPVRLVQERLIAGVWEDRRILTFEHPRAIPRAVFDPKTLVEHDD